MNRTPDQPETPEQRQYRRELPSLGSVRTALANLDILDPVPAHIPAMERRARLLYLISVHTHLMGDAAARVAGLDATQSALLHYQADADLASMTDAPELFTPMLTSGLIERLVWTHHTLVGLVQDRRTPIGEVVLDSLEAVLHLLQAYAIQITDDSEPHDEEKMQRGLEQFRKGLSKLQATFRALVEEKG